MLIEEKSRRGAATEDAVEAVQTARASDRSSLSRVVNHKETHHGIREIAGVRLHGSRATTSNCEQGRKGGPSARPSAQVHVRTSARGRTKRRNRRQPKPKPHGANRSKGRP